MKGKRIWLIGASEGIGEALALQLAQDGAQLILSARNVSRLDAVKASLSGDGHRALPVDVCQLESVQQAWQALEGRLPDIVIYNAGTYTPMAAQQFDGAAAEAMIDVNLRGAFRVVSTVLPSYLSQNKGHVVLVGSVAGYRGLPGAIGYGASKAAVNHFAENLRVDLKRTAIKVQLVCPGFVKTRLTEKNDFSMPCMVTPQYAAKAIAKGLTSSAFEIHFPKRFTYVLKLLQLLPHRLYFRCV